MPSRGSRRRAHNAASPSLHGVQEGLFPRFNDTTRRSDSPRSLSPRFVAFTWRYHRCVRSSILAMADAPSEAWEFSVPGSRPELTMETLGSLRFLGNPGDHCPCSPTPVGPNASVRPRVMHSAWSPHMSTTRTPYVFSFRGSITRPLTWLSTLRRASRPTPRKTRFWLLARLCQAGLATRRVSTKGFRVRGSSSFSKLA